MPSIIISLIAIVSLVFSGYAISKAPSDVQEGQLGAQLAVGGEVYYLSGSGVSSSATSLGLTKFGYTQPNGTYAKFTMPNFGDLGCVTIQPGNSSGKQEFASFTGITQNADGTATLSGVSRGLERYSPYSASTTLQTAHAGGSQVVVSNSPPCFYESYANATEDENVTGLWQFTQIPYTYGTATSTAQFATRAYANSLAVQGAATSTINTSGIGLLATGAQAAAGTYTLTSPYFLSTLISTSTYFGNYNNQVIVTKTNGGQANTIDPNFISTSSSYSWTASTTFSGATTTLNYLSIAADATRPIYFRGIPYIFPSTQGASSTILANNGSGIYTSNTIDQLLKTGDRLIIATTTTFTLSNSGTETTYAAGDTYTIPAGAMGTNGILHVVMTVSDFDFSNASDDQIDIDLKLGGTVVATLTKADQVVVDQDNFQGRIEFYVINKDSQSAQVVTGTFIADDALGSDTSGGVLVTTAGTATIDTTVSQQLTVTFDWVSASTDNVISISSLVANIE